MTHRFIVIILEPKPIFTLRHRLASYTGAGCCKAISASHKRHSNSTLVSVLPVMPAGRIPQAPAAEDKMARVDGRSAVVGGMGLA